MNILLIALLILGLCFFFIALQFFKSPEIEIITEEKLDQEKRKKSSSLIFRLLLPIISKFFIPWVSNLRIDNFRKEMKRMIISAGMEEEVSPDEFFSFRIILVGILTSMAAFVSVAYNVGSPFVLSLLFGLMGFVFPYMWLRDRRKRRHEDIRRTLPFVVDLLTLATEAGLDFMGSIGRVVEKAKPGPLIEELRRVLQQIQLGTSRADSLRNMSWRIQMSEVSSFIAVLVSADQMGAPIGAVLRAQADQIRTDRFVRAEKEGAKAAQKILIPLLVLILPAIFLVIFGPLVLRVMPDIGEILKEGFVGGR
ncbi:MAG: type II secretion system F family protein [Deltaproteobacteria bacterium]|nr:type II secretion system F family protein [Deltaproteobacteria bacterium]